MRAIPRHASGMQRRKRLLQFSVGFSRNLSYCLRFHGRRRVCPAKAARQRRSVESGFPVGPWPFLRAGQRVRIEYGALEGIEGTLAREAGASRIIVSVNALQRSVAVEVDRDMIRPI